MRRARTRFGVDHFVAPGLPLSHTAGGVIAGAMSLTLDFHGAAGTVTGSCYRIIHPKGSFLVDCVMFQGSKTLTALNYGPLPFPPRELDFLLLTHAHIDHSDMIPRLVKADFADRSSRPQAPSICAPSCCRTPGTYRRAKSRGSTGATASGATRK